MLKVLLVPKKSNHGM